MDRVTEGRGCLSTWSAPHGKLGRPAAHPRHQQGGPHTSHRSVLPASHQMPGERQRKAALVHSFPAPLPSQGRYAETRLFVHRGIAQGRRGHRHPPDRFARLPHSRKGGPDGPPFRYSIFSFDRPRPFSCRCLEKKMGADSPQEACAPRSPSGQSAAAQPGGQVISRPLSTWKCRWNTLCPACSPMLETTR